MIQPAPSNVCVDVHITYMYMLKPLFVKQLIYVIRDLEFCLDKEIGVLVI